MKGITWKLLGSNASLCVLGDGAKDLMLQDEQLCLYGTEILTVFTKIIYLFFVIVFYFLNSSIY